LYEALEGELPFQADTTAALATEICTGEPRPMQSSVPPHVNQAVMRGLATEPEQRFSDMPALLRALAHDPRQRRRRLIALGGAGAVLLGLGVLSGQTVGKEAPCAVHNAPILETWNPERAREIRQALGATNVPFAGKSADKLVSELDGYTDAWAQEWSSVCEASRRHEPVEVYRRRACLTRGTARVVELLAALSEPSAADVARVPDALASLPDLTVCNDAPMLEREGPLPRDSATLGEVRRLRGQLEKAVALRGLGRYEDAQRELTGLQPEVQALDYPPLHAEFALESGELAWETQDLARAVELVEAAYFSAYAVGAWRVVLTSATVLAELEGNPRADASRAEMWLRHADAAARWYGANDDALRSLDYARARVAVRSGDPDAALAVLERVEATLGEGDEDLTLLRTRAAALRSKGKAEEALTIYASVRAAS
jgi:tetratricopeptide (TPR) repeat protein